MTLKEEETHMGIVLNSSLMHTLHMMNVMTIQRQKLS